MIKLQIIGNLGKDCITNTVSGKNVMNFSVAHTEKYKDNQGNQQERVIWVECAYWSDRTAVAPYLKKGTMVYVEGTPEVKTYPKNDGSTGVSLNLRVQTVQLLGGSKNSAPGDYNSPAQNSSFSGSSANTATRPSDITEPVDDLPF